MPLAGLPTRSEYIAAVKRMGDFVIKAKDKPDIKKVYRVGERLDRAGVDWLAEISEYIEALEISAAYLSLTSDASMGGLQSYSRQVVNLSECMLEIAQDPELKMSSKVRRLTEGLRNLSTLTTPR